MSNVPQAPSSGGKSSIEAELEELRRQQISKSNAQRLGTLRD
jgi:hypothetical protein